MKIINHLQARIRRISFKKLSLHLKDWVFDHKVDLVVWAILLVLFFANTIHENFPDEFDNILGGWMVLKGTALYEGFFTHHNPLAYWVAASILLFTGQSFVAFRFGLAIMWWLIAFASWIGINKLFGKIWARLYLVAVSIWTISATYYWLHMLLADSLAGFLLIPTLVITTAWITQSSHRQPRLILLTTHIATWLLFLASQSYLYLVIAINGLSWLLFLSRTPYKNWFNKNILILGVLVLLPYFAFLGWYGIRGNLEAYVRHTYEFNARYYIYNYPKPVGEIKINPVRYAAITTHKILSDYRDLFKQIPSMPLHNAMNIAGMLVVTCLFILSLSKKQYAFSVLIASSIILTSFRSSPLESKMQDFQSAGYLAAVYWFTVCWFLQARHELNVSVGKAFSTLVLSFALILSGFFTIASGIHLVLALETHLFGKYMGTLPLIYDRPPQEPLISAFVPKSEAVWVGPFHFEDQFYLKNKPGSSYTIILPEFKYDTRIQEAIISQLKDSRPYLISMDTDYSVRGGNPFYDSKFFYDYLPTEYTKLDSVVKNGKELVSIANTEHTNLLEDWWVRTDILDEALEKLIELQYVRFE